MFPRFSMTGTVTVQIAAIASILTSGQGAVQRIGQPVQLHSTFGVLFYTSYVFEAIQVYSSHAVNYESMFTAAQFSEIIKSYIAC